MKKILLTAVLLVCMSQANAQQVKLKSLIGFYAAPQPAPNFHFYGPDGKRLSLYDFEGKVLLVHVWRVTCAVCIYELPSLARLEKAVGSPDFRVIIIHSGDETAFEVGKFLNARNIALAQSYLDKNARFTKTIRSSALPVSFIVDREGRELAREYGAVDWDSPAVRNQILGVIGRKDGEDADML